MKSIKFLLILLIFTPTTFSNPLTEFDKSPIYEIRCPPVRTDTGFSINRGTGIVIRDSLLGFMLATCRHVVQDEKGNYVDSIFIRRNKLLPTSQLISDTSEFVVRIKTDDLRFLVEHPNPNIDLVMILMLPINTTYSHGEIIYNFQSYKLLNKENFNKLDINEGIDIEVIGFSLSSSLGYKDIHYHFSRFGKIGLYTTNKFILNIENKPIEANYILLDMTIRPGDSGSPIIAYIKKNPFLIGFVSSWSSKTEFGVGYPVYYLYDLMSMLKERFRLLIEEIKK